jgi:hypothetical protein
VINAAAALFVGGKAQALNEATRDFSGTDYSTSGAALKESSEEVDRRNEQVVPGIDVWRQSRGYQVWIYFLRSLRPSGEALM